MSAMPILLVEGPSDVEFFEHLHKALNAGDVRIDDADFKMPGGDENRRANVEHVAKEIVNNHKEVINRFTAFADREFDHFAFEQSPIRDRIGAQRQDGRLIYSRGHSIENYAFDYDLIVDALEEHYPTASIYRSMALNNMREFFDQILCIACAISLSAYKNKLIGAINGLLYHINEWDSEKAIMSYNQTEQSVVLNRDEFRKCLLEGRRVGSSRNRADDFIGSYDRYLDIISRDENRETAQWLCHGHIGVHIIRLAYAMFIYDSFTTASLDGNPPLTQINQMLRDTNRLPLRAKRLPRQIEPSSWVQYYCDHIDKDTSPAYCFAALGVLP